MIYSNVEIDKKTKEMEWGNLDVFEFGEQGRGRKMISLPTFTKKDSINKGWNKDLTIGITRNGKPRVNEEEDEDIYVLLSSYGGYTRRGCGYIQVPVELKDKFEVMASGNGADGDAGRIGYWNVICMKIPREGTYCIRIKMSGGCDPSYILYHDGELYDMEFDELCNICDAKDIDIPFPLQQDGSVDKKFWHTL